MILTRFSFFLHLAATVSAIAQQFTPTQEALQAMGAVSPGSFMGHIRFFSDDRLEGRGPGTRSDRLTQLYIASHMEMLGLKPAGENGTYFQRVPIVSMQTDPSTTLSVSGTKGVLDLKYASEFVAFTGNQQTEVSVSDAEIVFVGYGIVAPEQGWDDYKDVDVAGKVLMMMNNDPSPDDPRIFGGKARTYYGRWTYKYEIAAKKGAAGAIIIHTTESAGYGWNVVESSWSGGRAELGLKPGTPRTKVNGWTTLDATNKILSLAGKSLDKLQSSAQKKSFKPVPLGIKASITVRTKIGQLETANVLGALQGSDPQLKDEVVVFGAHHDHLGIGKPVKGDSIYNGAVDNASGSSALLNIGRMFTALKEQPHRSILFAALAAEESGLIGSQYYAENPTYPPGKIAAYINIDGINVLGKTNDMGVIGFGKSSIDKIAEAVAAWQGRVLKPDQFPEQGSFYRSDQFNFAKIGVPCMYLKVGTDYVGKPPGFGHEKHDEYIKNDYHQPSDETKPEWDLSGAVVDAQLMFLVGLKIAGDDAMPVWNKGDEFEAARLKALGQ